MLTADHLREIASQGQARAVRVELHPSGLLLTHLDPASATAPMRVSRRVISIDELASARDPVFVFLDNLRSMLA